MNSLRRQLTRWLLGTLALLVGAALVAIYVVVWDELTDAFDNTLRARAALIAGQLRRERDVAHLEVALEMVRRFGGGDKPRHFVELRDREGRVLAQSGSLRDGNLPRFKGDEVRFGNLKLPTGRPGRSIGMPLLQDAKGKPEFSLVLASDREDLDETLGGLLAAVAGAGVGLLAAVWLIVPWVLRRGLRPLGDLGERVARIDADTLSAPLPVDGLPSELRPIGDRLNALLARLAGSFERERRFSADLAHELRTPLAELRSLAECALKWPESREATTDQEVLAIATQMEALVGTMLALARGERGRIAAELAPVEVATLVAEVARPWGERAQARGLRLNLAVAPASVRADATLLRSILVNLFDNAVAYAPAGAEVRVTGEAKGTGYVLRCANPVGDLTADDVTKLFERFWRKEAARSGGGEHVGLGLSLAQTLATAMGWRLSAKLADGSLVFSLETSSLPGRRP
jgi:signal transduction histidine kinase